MLLYKKLLLLTFGTTLVYYKTMHSPYNVKRINCFLFFTLGNEILAREIFYVPRGSRVRTIAAIIKILISSICLCAAFTLPSIRYSYLH